MNLSFPNQSRSYDADRRQVRFMGYAGMTSVPFRINVDALLLKPDSGEDGSRETASLEAFDRRRASIERAAARAYSGTRRTVYVLTSDDLG